MINVPSYLIPPPKDERYSSWGSSADLIKSQGFYPETTQPNGVTVFRSNYSPAFNDVAIPGEKEKGHIAVIGNKNKTFDIVIRNSNGDVKQLLAKSQTPEDAQTFLTQSIVGTRNNAVLKNTAPTNKVNLLVSK